MTPLGRSISRDDRRRRGRDPAAVRVRGRHRLPRDGHRQRRPGRSSPIQRKGEDARSGRGDPGRRRRPAAAGLVGRPRRDPRRSQRPGRRLAGAASAARPSRSGSAPGGDRRAGRDGGAARDRRRPLGRRRACSPPARWCSSACLRRRRLPGDQLDHGRARRRDDPALDGDDPDGRRRPGRRRAGGRGPHRRAVRAPRRAVRASPRSSASSSATWRPR